jgi:hypothetical protein
VYDAGGASDDDEDGDDAAGKSADLRYDMDSQRDYTYTAPKKFDDDEDIDSDEAFDSDDEERCVVSAPRTCSCSRCTWPASSWPH